MKIRFFMDDAHIKATTVHSFKGWEARAVVLYAGSYSLKTPYDWHTQG